MLGTYPSQKYVISDPSHISRHPKLQTRKDRSFNFLNIRIDLEGVYCTIDDSKTYTTLDTILEGNYYFYPYYTFDNVTSERMYYNTPKIALLNNKHL